MVYNHTTSFYLNMAAAKAAALAPETFYSVKSFADQNACTQNQITKTWQSLEKVCMYLMK